MLLKEWQALKSGQGRWTSPCQSTAKTSEMELARPRSHSHCWANIQLQPGPCCTTPFLPFIMHSQSTMSLQAWIYQTRGFIFCSGQTVHHDAWARDKNWVLTKIFNQIDPFHIPVDPLGPQHVPVVFGWQRVWPRVLPLFPRLFVSCCWEQSLHSEVSGSIHLIQVKSWKPWHWTTWPYCEMSHLGTWQQEFNPKNCFQLTNRYDPAHCFRFSGNTIF